ncbi:class I SAM-dependent methyltransferase [Bergeyella sp. RCAD1439]|uniref:class I SAM-dependent methyltransferase n=1 Tax=Bergeyella anatis TaxID=3113737 RepID=UPI002E17C6B3|nr:class I SAM-dependent methyltransferase [Bergeyella sp. RCAD1439]
MGKIQKFFKLLNAVSREPSRLNAVLLDNEVQRGEHLKKYPHREALPQVGLEAFGGEVLMEVELFLSEGGSLPMDHALLKTLASARSSYFEIGTWRGESVWNVSRVLQDCTTLNLSASAIEALGYSSRYAKQHGMLSCRNPGINHLEGDTKTFDFASLGRRYDLVFIDGDHSYAMVRQDTEKVFEHLVHSDTVVVWHDYAFNPGKVRYEVFMAILDALPEALHGCLYHVAHTMCAVFYRGEVAASAFDPLKEPEHLYRLDIKKQLLP